MSAVMRRSMSYISSKPIFKPATGQSVARIERCSAEALDAVQHHGADAFIGRLRIIAHGVGDLEHDVGLAAETRHRVAPALHALLVAVDRARAMVHDEPQVRDASSDVEHRVDLVGVHHQLEDQAEAGQAGDVLPPRRVIGLVAARGERLFRLSRMEAEDVANPDDAGISGLLLDDARRLRRAEGGGGGVADRDAARLVERLEPLRLAQRIGRVPQRLDMHAGDDVLVGGVSLDSRRRGNCAAASPNRPAPAPNRRTG